MFSSRSVGTNASKRGEDRHQATPERFENALLFTHSRLFPVCVRRRDGGVGKYRR